MKVEITNPKTIVVTEQQTKTYNELTVKKLVDFPKKRKLLPLLQRLTNLLFYGKVRHTMLLVNGQVLMFLKGYQNFIQHN